MIRVVLQELAALVVLTLLCSTIALWAVIIGSLP
jgi:hypothetical protein